MLLEVSEARSGYGRLEILHGVSLKVSEGEFVALLGPNGAGKTTLIRTILGGCDIVSGRVALDGVDITRLPIHARAGLRIACSPIAVEAVASVLRRLRDERLCAILLVEQQTQVALSLAERAYILSQGAIQAQGPASDLAQDPDLATVYFGARPTLSSTGTD
jgi:ABC-type branched-subunit amino acid transport system ATPase component